MLYLFSHNRQHQDCPAGDQLKVLTHIAIRLEKELTEERSGMVPLHKLKSFRFNSRDSRCWQEQGYCMDLRALHRRLRLDEWEPIYMFGRSKHNGGQHRRQHHPPLGQYPFQRREGEREGSTQRRKARHQCAVQPVLEPSLDLDRRDQYGFN